MEKILQEKCGARGKSVGTYDAVNGDGLMEMAGCKDRSG